MGNPFTNPTMQYPVPINQLNALPLIGTQTFIDGAGGTGIIIGGNVTRFWDVNATKINGSSFHNVGGHPDANENWVLATPFLDVTPCIYFAFTIYRYCASADAAKPISFYNQYKLDPSETDASIPLTNPSGYALNVEILGMNQFNTTAIQFPAEAAGAVQRFTLLASPNSQPGSVARNVPMSIGPFVRFIMGLGGTGPVLADTSTYSMSIIGSS